MTRLFILASGIFWAAVFYAGWTLILGSGSIYAAIVAGCFVLAGVVRAIFPGDISTY